MAGLYLSHVPCLNASCTLLSSPPNRKSEIETLQARAGHPQSHILPIFLEQEAAVGSTEVVVGAVGSMEEVAVGSTLAPAEVLGRRAPSEGRLNCRMCSV